MNPGLSSTRCHRAVISLLLLATGVGAPAAAAEQIALYPKDALTPIYERAARYILGQKGIGKKGYCFVYGAGQGRLAFHLARQSDRTIFGVVQGTATLQAARRALHAADLYGMRITLHGGALDRLRYRDYSAALVVCDAVIATGTCPGTAAEMFRMVRPDGGVALIGQPPGCPARLRRADLERWLSAARLTYRITEDADGLWARIDRGPLPGAGAWTHMLADVANTACSGDARTTDRFQVLWFGEPGPSVMVDRHWEPVAPLYKGGRLIVPGFDRVVCCDAYNGARLWDLRVPHGARIAMMRDAGWLALGDEYLYVAVKNQCLKVGLETGRIADTTHTPTDGLDWGYLAVDGEQLFGSEQTHEASYLAANIGRGAEGNQLGRGDDRLLITSKRLFCRDRTSNELLWTYASEAGRAVIANVTVCIGGGAVYFFESADPGAVSDADGRVPMTRFTNGEAESLVKLDRQTGKVLWRRQHDMICRHVLHLSYAHGVLVASGCTTKSGNYWYHLRAFKATDGSPLWRQDLDSTFDVGDKNHGKQDKHPVIVGNVVYLKQGNFDLATGRPLGLRFFSSNCADVSASTRHAFTRNQGVARMIDLDRGGHGVPLCSVMRPGCYISIIPAGGIIMLPAFSAGCTCDYSLQTTIAWLPQ